MPFKKTGKDEYRSPSGKKYTGKQVKAYYATDGFSREPRKPKASSKSKHRGRS